MYRRAPVTGSHVGYVWIHFMPTRSASTPWAMTMPSPVVPTVSVECTDSSRSGLYWTRISTLEPKPPVARTKALPVNS